MQWNDSLGTGRPFRASSARVSRRRRQGGARDASVAAYVTGAVHGIWFLLSITGVMAARPAALPIDMPSHYLCRSCTSSAAVAARSWQQTTRHACNLSALHDHASARGHRHDGLQRRGGGRPTPDTAGNFRATRWWRARLSGISKAMRMSPLHPASFANRSPARRGFVAGRRQSPVRAAKTEARHLRQTHGIDRLAGGVHPLARPCRRRLRDQVAQPPDDRVAPDLAVHARGSLTPGLAPFRSRLEAPSIFTAPRAPPRRAAILGGR